MKLSIWQQFSSNHSADFIVIGKFTTFQKAEEVAEIFWRMFAEITDDRRQYKETPSISLTPKEAEIKQKYNIQTEWLQGFQWTHNVEITIVDNHLLLENKYLSQSWTNSAYIFEEILQAYTPQTWVADTGDSDGEFITYDLSCIAPNENLANQIYKKFSAMHKILTLQPSLSSGYLASYKREIIRYREEQDFERVNELADKIEALEVLYPLAFGDPQLPPAEYSDTGLLELYWSTNPNFMHHPHQGIKRNRLEIDFIDVELGSDMEDLQELIHWLGKLGFKEIKYQFHPNTTRWYSFTLAAKFTSQIKAQQASVTLQQVLRRIADWHEQNPEDAINFIRAEKASSVEKDIATEYDVEWDCHLYWANHKWLDNETTIMVIDHYLFIVSKINYKAPTSTYAPIKSILEKLGASVLSDEKFYAGAPNFAVDITGHLSNQTLGQEIQQSTETYLLCKARRSKLPFMSWIHFSPNIRNLTQGYLEQLRQKAQDYSLTQHQLIMACEGFVPSPMIFYREFLQEWRNMWKDFDRATPKLPDEERYILNNAARGIDIHCMKNIEPVTCTDGLLEFNQIHFEDILQGLPVFLEWLKSRGCTNITFDIQLADGDIETGILWD